MKQINYFIELTRLKKPIGFMLLFWPCLWGLTIAFDFSKDIQIFIKYLLLFFLGSVLMRSAGCIINDVFDKDYDNKLLRIEHFKESLEYLEYEALGKIKKLQQLQYLRLAKLVKE